MILANAWYLAMVVLSNGRPQPPVGDPEFRLVGFVAGVAMWWADAAFGLVSLRLEVADRLRLVARGGALALAIGSVLAFAGMDRLGLVRGDLAWLFTPAAMLGIALNGDRLDPPRARRRPVEVVDCCRVGLIVSAPAGPRRRVPDPSLLMRR